MVSLDPRGALRLLAEQRSACGKRHGVARPGRRGSSDLVPGARVTPGPLGDPEYGKERGCEGTEKPAALLGPHVAALGMRFYTGTSFPAAYRNQIFIAEHGSWNRSQKIGYRVMLARLDGNRVTSYEPFADGWLQGDTAWGRPVDVQVAPDGALLVSDDQAGVIYRISYR